MNHNVRLEKQEFLDLGVLSWNTGHNTLAKDLRDGWLLGS